MVSSNARTGMSAGNTFKFCSFVGGNWAWAVCAVRAMTMKGVISRRMAPGVVGTCQPWQTVRTRSRWRLANLIAACGCLVCTTRLSIPRHDQHQAGSTDSLQDAIRHRSRDRIAGSRHRSERGDLLALRPDASPTAAGARAARAGESRRPWAEAGLAVVQQRRWLRRRLQLSDVP